MLFDAAKGSTLAEARALCRWMIACGKKARSGFETTIMNMKFRLEPSFIEARPVSTGGVNALSGSPDMILMNILSNSHWSLQFALQMDECFWKVPVVDLRGKVTAVEYEMLSNMPGWFADYNLINNLRGDDGSRWNHNSEYMGMCYLYRYGQIKPRILLADPDDRLDKDLLLIKLEIGDQLAAYTPS